MFQIYLVENDTQLNHLFSLYLQKEGWVITSFLKGEKACQYIDKCPHMWIIDSFLPDIDGYQVLNEVKEKQPNIPVIMISERNSSMDRIIGMEMGCDDYLPKPFLPKELVIRSKKILDRTYDFESVSRGLNIHHYSIYKIDEIARIVYKGSDIIKLTSKEFDLLLLLAKNPLRAFSRNQILKYVWEDEHFGSDRSVDDLVRRLRKKMNYLRIESIYGYGYRLLYNSK
jgi:two-component system response regulator CssR